MDFIIEGAGIFIYPLGLCSFLALYIMIERFIALRESKIIPKDVLNALISGRIPDVKGDFGTAAARIINFYTASAPEPEALKAFASLEVSRMERGMFWLDVVVSASPLLGLLGTVAGLVTVFATSDGRIPDPESISRGVGLALSTTIIGLSIAIPSVVANSYLNRRIDKLCARINVGVECLIEMSHSKGE